MTALRPTLPFPLLGFDTDNDSVFMNETIKGWCETAPHQSRLSTEGLQARSAPSWLGPARHFQAPIP